MTIDTQARAVEQMVETMLAGDPQYFLVEVKIRPTNNIKVFLDGDNGIPIERCVVYNRSLYKAIEESGLFPADDFSLEVSSPGLDEPLKSLRQYRKNIGRKVEVLLKDGQKTEGTLLAVSDDAIDVQELKGKKTPASHKQAPQRPGKKQEAIEHHFLFESIKSTKIQIVF